MKKNFKRGALDVFQKNKKIDSHELYSLISFCKRGSDFPRWSTAILYPHLEILRSALNQTRFILSDQPHHSSIRIPLWVKLFKKGRSLRNLSSQWFGEAKKFLLLFRINLDAVTNEIESVQYRLSLGLASKIEADLSDFQLAKLQLFQKSFFYSEMELAKMNLDPSEHLSILAFQVARGSKREMINSLEMIEDVLHFLSLRRQIEPLRQIHILNSINLVSFRMGRFEEAERRITDVHRIAKFRLKVAEERNHALGIVSFHRGLLEIEKGNRNRAIQNLENSKNLDRGFFDCHYRLASLFHDLGDKRAKIEYEQALKLSVFDFPLVNDFGVLLKEMNLTREFESLLALSKVLGLDEADHE